MLKLRSQDMTVNAICPNQGFARVQGRQAKCVPRSEPATVRRFGYIFLIERRAAENLLGVSAPPPSLVQCAGHGRVECAHVLTC
jgi:hypothetical protein